MEVTTIGSGDLWSLPLDDQVSSGSDHDREYRSMVTSTGCSGSDHDIESGDPWPLPLGARASSGSD